MRAVLFTFFGTGFLALIALSWLATDTAVSTATVSVDRTPASTPVASRAEIQRLLAAGQGDAAAVALAEHFTNFGADADLARAALESSAPLAQAVGLKMLAALPPSGENLSALGTGLRHPTDPALAEGAVRELERYLGTRYEADAQRIVESLVGYGERTPAERAAALVRPFINEHSYEEFKELLPRLSSDVEAARFLRNALEEYDRHRRGG